MNQIKVLFCSTFISLCAIQVTAKSADTSGFYFFTQKEKELQIIAPLIISGESDSLRNSAAAQLYNALDSLLRIPSSYFYPFDSLKNSTVSILMSPDKSFRLFTFNKILNNGTFHHFGFIQLKYGKNIDVFGMMDTVIQKTAVVEEQELGCDNWYGALYYSIVPYKYKRQKFYMLIGFDGSDIHSNKKVLDILWFNRGEPVFGQDVFYDGLYDKKPTSRVIFEFHNEGRMILRYEEKQKIVVLDKLAPAFPAAVNDYYYYIPSGDYDYYQLSRDGFWVKDAMSNFNLGQGKRPKKVKTLPDPSTDPQNLSDPE